MNILLFVAVGIHQDMQVVYGMGNNADEAVDDAFLGDDCPHHLAVFPIRSRHLDSRTDADGVYWLTLEKSE